MITEPAPHFLAIDPDMETRSLLAQMLSAASDEVGPLPGRLAPSDNWHITVRYLGAVDDTFLDRLLYELDQSSLGGSFPVDLGGFGTFPGDEKATVLWVGVESAGLTELAADVEDLVRSLGADPDERPYRPHLTLSRVRPPLDLSDLTAAEWGRLRFTATELVLFRTVSSPDEGVPVRYEPVDRFPL